MDELFDKKEINPTVKVMISMNQEERNEIKAFAEQMNLSVSALTRLAIKNFIKLEGSKYGKN